MILVTNDDGIHSEGISALYKAAVAVFGISNVAVVAPDGPRSASGMSLTFHKPLRVGRIEEADFSGFATSGTPADCVFIAMYKLLKGKSIDLVLSGINHGSNASLQSIESSGTVSAVKFGAAHRVKGIAFSLAVEMGEHKEMFAKAAGHVEKMLKLIAKNGFPRGVDILNVNIPSNISNKTKWKICSFEPALFKDFVIERKDPTGKKYYWLAGNPKRQFGAGTDCRVLFVDKEIAISPIELSSISARLKEETARVLNAEIA